MLIRINRKRFLALVLVLFITFCIYNPSGFISVPGYVSKAAFLLISVFSIFKLYRGDNKSEIHFFNCTVLKMFIFPEVLILCYSIFITLAGNDGYLIIESTIDLMISRIMIITFLWACVRRLGIKAIDYFFYGCFLSYTYTVVSFFLHNGIINGLSMISIGSYGLSLEVHNMTYIFGYFFIYYLLIEQRVTKTNEKKPLLKILICFLYVYLGQKRMVLIANLLAVFVWFLLFKVAKKDRKKIVIGASAIIICISMLYVWFINSGYFESFVILYNIKTSSRLNFYTYFNNSYEFSPLYWGRGITYTDEVMSSATGMADLNLISATTVHNDILRLFVGIGFIPTIIYLALILYNRVIVIGKEFGEEISFLYFVLAIYYFVNWFASNAGMEMWCYSGFVICVLTILHEVLVQRDYGGCKLKNE